MNAITQQLLEDLASLPLDLQEEALDFVRFLKTKQLNSATTTMKPSEFNSEKAIEILNEIALRGTAFSDITDSVAWQKDLRQARQTIAGQVITMLLDSNK